MGTPLKNVRLLVTMDAGRRRIPGGGLFVRDNIIQAVGPTRDLPGEADRDYLDAGVRVGLAVDGSASNDSSHMLAEARMALLLQRVARGAGALTVDEALEMATLGGARVLGRDDVGSLAPGKAADFIGIRLDRLEYAGAACHDPLGSIVMCTPPSVDLSVIDGRLAVEGGRIPGLDLERATARQNELARQMVRRAAARH
jgi:8-oxoguanine deaminase